jgi:hypothetical protein
MVLGAVLVGIFENAIRDLPSRADAHGKIHPADMANALRSAVSGAGGGSRAFETALACLADAMGASGVADPHNYLLDQSATLTLDEAHAYMSQALRIVKAL